jgi:hypothetical protein
VSAKEPTKPAMPIPTPPRAVPAPTITGGPAPVASVDSAQWGRVSDGGTVEVRENDQWRVVGQYPDGTADEALAYFVRKFDELAFRVTTLEQRLLSGGATATQLLGQTKALSAELVDAAVVGDLASLSARLESLRQSLDQAAEQEAQAAKEAVDAAIAQRTTLVERIEQLAGGDLSNVHWKKLTAEVAELFESWQEQQRTGPRLPKGASQELWKRFRDARTKIDKERRVFFASQDEQYKAAKDQKTRIAEKAEALASKGAEGIPNYRDLLEEWKKAGSAGRKVDDSLWARMKAAGDTLYGARAEQSAADAAESEPKIAARTALLEEAAAIADISDLKQARATLGKLQKRWDEVGRIFPRDKERALDDKLRAIESALKAREDEHWKRNNPETKARAGSMAAQLEDAIAKLETELAEAKAAGNKQAVAEAEEALSARRAWLGALSI